MRLLNRLGFSMDEVMSGSHKFLDGRSEDTALPMEFDVKWGAPSLGDFITPGPKFFKTDLAGTVTVGGLCEAAPCKGNLTLGYFKDASIRYDFKFTVHGIKYQFIGEKVNIKPWNLPVSHTTCFGLLTEIDSGRLISRSLTFFKLGTVPSFLASFRLNFRRGD
jgi:hypothetical protein